MEIHTMLIWGNFAIAEIIFVDHGLLPQLDINYTYHGRKSTKSTDIKWTRGGGGSEYHSKLGK